MTKHRQSVAVNNFVLRQIEGSGKTFCKNLTFQQIAEYAENQLNTNPSSIQPGYRDGVLLIQCEPKMNIHFESPMVKIDENTKLEAIVTNRRNEENPYIQIRALNGNPLKSGNVEIILYHHDVLAETKEQESTEGWELIAFHAIPEGIDHIPMGPITMMRNQLQLEGGTKGEYNSDEWAESVNFWQKYAVLQTSRDN